MVTKMSIFDNVNLVIVDKLPLNKGLWDDVVTRSSVILHFATLPRNNF